MLSKLKQSVSNEVLSNKVQYLLIVFFIVVGITAGTFTVSRMSGAAKAELAGYTQALLAALKNGAADHGAVLLYSFLQNTAVFAAAAAFALLMIGLPAIAAALICKGFCVGFTIGVLSLSLGSGGFASIVFAVILPNLVLLPCVCKAGALGWNHSMSVIRSRSVPRTTRDRLIMAKPFFKKIGRVWAAALAGVLLQWLLCPALLRLV